MTTFVYIIGCAAIGVITFKITRYLHVTFRSQNTITSDWFREHEYRSGKKGFDQ